MALPRAAWSKVLGSISVWQVAVPFAVLFVLVAVVRPWGLGWSALISRPAEHERDGELVSALPTGQTGAPRPGRVRTYSPA